MAKRRKKKRNQRLEHVEVRITGPPVRGLVERIRDVLEGELLRKEKRYQTKGLEWTNRRYERALDALDERRAAK